MTIRPVPAASDAPGTDALFATLRATAPAEKDCTADIAASISALADAGMMLDDGTADPAVTARALMRVGAANLPVGRLWEGHVNALYLVRVHGGARVLAGIAGLVRKGAVLGVWGADGPDPVRTGDATLTGGKLFASGLGTVTHAVVTVDSGPQVRLGLVDVRDGARGDPGVWRMMGMQATASGACDLNGIPLADVTWLGGPGDYLIEPHFVGGVWRIAALQAGAAIGLLDAVADVLRARGRLDAPPQIGRLADVMVRAMAAAALVMRAASAVVDGAPDDAVTLSAAARLSTEEVGLDAIRAAEQCLGLAHFAEGSETGRMARDLAVYMRQAARDALVQRVGAAAFAGDGAVWRLV